MKKTSIWNIIIFAIYFALIKPEANVNFEQQLRHELFNNRKLNPISRPGRYHNDTMNIIISSKIQAFNKLDPQRNIVKMSIFLDLHWENRDLAWNPRDYGGIEAIHVKPSLIWIPYFTLLNSVTKIDENILHSTRAVVRNNGNVILITPFTSESRCVIDMHRFPFDRHSCTLIFGSWTHDGTHVNITGVNAKKDDEGNDFVLIKVNARSSTYRHTCCREVYSVALFEYEFERRSSLYQVGILLPAALICLLTAGIFWVTPLKGNRLKMCLILLLANLVLLINLGLSIPISINSTPPIVIFCVHALGFTTLALILSMVAISLSAKHPSIPAPACTQALIDGWLMKYLLIHVEDDESEKRSRGWLILVAILDRISFLVFSTSFLLMFILYLH